MALAIVLVISGLCSVPLLLMAARGTRIAADNFPIHKNRKLTVRVHSDHIFIIYFVCFALLRHLWPAPQPLLNWRSGFFLRLRKKKQKTLATWWSIKGTPRNSVAEPFSIVVDPRSVNKNRLRLSASQVILKCVNVSRLLSPPYYIYIALQ